MEVEYGAKVIDKNNETLGTINQIIRDTWTGKIRKFVVLREAPAKDLFLSPADTTEVTKDAVKLNITREELNSQ